MKYTVDSIEDGVVSCEDEKENHVNIELVFLPEGVKEGDVVEVIDGRFLIRREETDERRKKMAALQNSIFTKKK